MANRDPGTARIYLCAQPQVEGTDDSGKPIVERQADIALVIDQNDGSKPERELLSATQRISEKERKTLERLFRKLVESGAKTG